MRRRDPFSSHSNGQIKYVCKNIFNGSKRATEVTNGAPGCVKEVSLTLMPNALK
jgi:hypothetical protein